MYLNLGIYGIPRELAAAVKSGTSEGDYLFPMVSRVRKLERWLREVGGFQHTYCDSFQTEEEFELMFDHGLYDRMRVQYGEKGGCRKGVFPRVWAKTRPEMDVFAWLAEEEENEKKGK